MSLRHEVALPNDPLMVKGTVGYEMFIITKGEVDVYSVDEDAGNKSDSSTPPGSPPGSKTADETEGLIQIEMNPGADGSSTPTSPRSRAALHDKEIMASMSRLGRLGAKGTAFMLCFLCLPF